MIKLVYVTERKMMMFGCTFSLLDPPSLGSLRDGQLQRARE